MVTKSITKLIDEAIIPALALIVAKTLGLFLASSIFKLDFIIEQGGIFKILPTVRFLDPQSYVMAENYSNLAMLFVAAFGAILIIVRAHFFHQSHIHPYLHAKLVSLNLESLIAPSYNLYHQAVVWLTYFWLVVAYLIVSSIFGVTFPQISVIAFIIAANFSWVFAIDIQREIEIQRRI